MCVERITIRVCVEFGAYVLLCRKHVRSFSCLQQALKAVLTRDNFLRTALRVAAKNGLIGARYIYEHLQHPPDLVNIARVGAIAHGCALQRQKQFV